MEENKDIYLAEIYQKRIKILSWVFFAVILLLSSPLYYLMITKSGFFGVYLFAAIFIVFADIMFVLVNGLLYAKNYKMQFCGETTRISKGIYGFKNLIFRKSSVLKVSVKTRTYKKVRYYNVKFFTEAGNATARYLSKQEAKDFLMSYGVQYDERIFSDQA